MLRLCCGNDLWTPKAWHFSSLAWHIKSFGIDHKHLPPLETAVVYVTYSVKIAILCLNLPSLCLLQKECEDSDSDIWKMATFHIIIKFGLQNTVFCILCSVFYFLCSVIYVLCTMFCVLCFVLCVLCYVLCVLSSMFCVLCTVFCVLCSVFCVLCSVYCACVVGLLDNNSGSLGGGSWHREALAARCSYRRDPFMVFWWHPCGPLVCVVALWWPW